MEAHFLQQAIRMAEKAIEQGQSPFGAVIVHQGRVLVSAHNTVWRDLDPTAHAEVNAIRLACRELRTIDLSGTVMYTTTEPCPMCLTAIHWAKIDRVVFGASIADAGSAGFSELRIPAEDMVEKGGSPLRIQRGLCREECAALFGKFLDHGGKVY